jgi:hypothetical protein
MSGWKLERGCTITLILRQVYRFLPFADHTYQQAPYQDIDADEYLEWNGRVPNITRLD